jgi:hypothetical protein
MSTLQMIKNVQKDIFSAIRQLNFLQKYTVSTFLYFCFETLLLIPAQQFSIQIACPLAFHEPHNKL